MRDFPGPRGREGSPLDAFEQEASPSRGGGCQRGPVEGQADRQATRLLGAPAVTLHRWQRCESSLFLTELPPSCAPRPAGVAKTSGIGSGNMSGKCPRDAPICSSEQPCPSHHVVLHLVTMAACRSPSMARPSTPAPRSPLRAVYRGKPFGAGVPTAPFRQVAPCAVGASSSPLPSSM